MPVMLRINRKYRKIAEKILNLKQRMYDKKKDEDTSDDTKDTEDKDTEDRDSEWLI